MMDRSRLRLEAGIILSMKDWLVQSIEFMERMRNEKTNP